MNLGHLARKVLLIFQDNCVQQYQEALALHGSRMRYQPLGFRGSGFRSWWGWERALSSNLPTTRASECTLLLIEYWDADGDDVVGNCC